MNFQWTAPGGPYPIVEFHDVRTEPGGVERYLSRVEAPVSGRLVAGGSLGQFAVSRHPDRLLLLRGYASLPARRRALTSLQTSEDWAERRTAAADLTRSNEVMLMRAITPESGPRPWRAGEGCVALISELRFPEQIGNYHLWLRLLLRKAGMDPVAAFATLEAVNDVPSVPVVRNRAHHIALMRTGGKVPELPHELRDMLRFSPEVLTLESPLAPVW